MASFWDSDTQGYTNLGVPQAWVLWLLDQPVPGFAEVDCEVAIATDRAKPTGADAGRVVVHGRQPVELAIRIHLWTPAQWDEWVALLPKLAPQVGRQAAQAISIVHGSLEGLGIGSVVVLSVSNPRPGRVPGERVVTLRAVEWRKPAKQRTATKKPKQAQQVLVAPAFDTNITFADGTTGFVPLPANQSVQPSASTPGPDT